MPTNLGEQAKAKWAEAQAARDPALKLKLLREFSSMIPKHKGVEKLEVSIKRQIKTLQEEIEKAKKRRRGSSRSEWVVKKNDMIQLGVTGSLQSSSVLFNTLTKMSVRNGQILMRPMVGVFEKDALKIQIVLAPYDKTIGEEKQRHFINLLRNVDGIVVALGFEPITYVHELLEWFEKHNIEVLSPSLTVEIVPMPSGGIRVAGRSFRCSEEEIAALASSYRIRNAVVKVSSTAALDDVEAAIFGRMRKNAMFVTLGPNRRDELVQIVPAELLQEGLAITDRLVAWFLNKLNLIRVYTKRIGEEQIARPLLLKEGSRIMDAAQMVHKDLVRFFRYAKLWRQHIASPIRVGSNFQLKDGDTVEIHAV